MKRLVIFLTAIFFSFSLFTAPLFAQSVTQDIRDAVDSSLGLTINNKTGSEIQPGDIISALLPFLLIFSGIILLVMLVWGGFEMLMNATDAKAQEAGMQRMKASAIGFLLLFTSVWIGQIAQIVFNITIFGT